MNDEHPAPRPAGPRPPRFTRAHLAALEAVSHGLPPDEEALILHRIITETGCTQRALVPLTGLSQSTISKRLKLLRDPQLRCHVPRSSAAPEPLRRPYRGEEKPFADWCADQAHAAGWTVVREFRAYLPNSPKSKHVDLVLFGSREERRALRARPRVAIEVKIRIGTPSELSKAIEQASEHEELLRCPYRLVAAELAARLDPGPVRTIDQFLDELHTGWVQGFPRRPA